MKPQDYIKDEAREVAMNCIESCCEEGGSLIINAEHGHGKSELLKRITKSHEVISSFALVHQILGKMAQQQNPKVTRKDEYRELICKMERKVYVFDEATELKTGIFPFFKSIIDANHTLIFAGRPAFYNTLSHKDFQDLRSRLTVVTIKKISASRLYELYQDFSSEAFEALDGKLDNMREMETVANHCRRYAKAHDIGIINIETVKKFLPGL